MPELGVDTCDCDVLVVGRAALVGLGRIDVPGATGITGLAGGAACHDIESSQVARCQCPNDGKLYRSAGIEEAIRAAGEKPFRCGDRRQPRPVNTNEYHLPPRAGPPEPVEPHHRINRLRPGPNGNPFLFATQRRVGCPSLFYYGCTAVNIEQQESTVTADVVWSPSTVGTRRRAGRATESDHPHVTWWPPTVPGARSAPAWA